MAKISVKRRSDFERTDGRAALYADVYIQRQKIRIPLEISVTSEQWDPVKEVIKGRGSDVKDQNLIIANAKARISDIFVRARLSGETLSRDSFLAQYRRPVETGMFSEFAHQHLNSMRKALSWETQKQHSAVLKKLDAYKADLRFEDITLEFLRIYAAHLRDSVGNNPTTVAKNLSVIRLYYYAAMRAGKVKVNPFEQLRLPKAQPAIIYLNEEEFNSLIALYKSNTLPDNQHDALRFFLFMCFTGMHITDARMLQIEQIFGEEIHYTRIKTKTKVAVPMSAPAAKLVEFYSAGRYRGNLFLKLPTDQAFNRLIKRVAKHANIFKAISAKAARHTFATLYYKRNNDIATLSRLLGHTSINTTMIYAHTMKDMRVAGVHAFDDFM